MSLPVLGLDPVTWDESKRSLMLHFAFGDLHDEKLSTWPHSQSISGTSSSQEKSSRGDLFVLVQKEEGHGCGVRNGKGQLLEAF